MKIFSQVEQVQFKEQSASIGDIYVKSFEKNGNIIAAIFDNSDPRRRDILLKDFNTFRGTIKI